MTGGGTDPRFTSRKALQKIGVKLIRVKKRGKTKPASGFAIFVGKENTKRRLAGVKLSDLGGRKAFVQKLAVEWRAKARSTASPDV